MIPSKISGESDADAEAEARPPVDDLDPETRFDNLRMFYQGQIAAATPSNGPLSFGADFNYASPNALSRIMGIYTSAYTTKKKVAKPVPMREATSLSEGLVPLSSTSESSIIDRLRSVGISGTTTTPQRLAQLNHTTRFTSDLRPIPFTLRTKRAKRCRCRHIVSKPESKLNTTRYRIRLLASSFIPNLALKPFPANPSTPSPLMSPTTPLSATLPSASSAAGGLTQAQTYLVPGKTHHFVLSVKNPLFEHVKVNLATPGHTPGRFRHRVTILCPQFEIGATRDVWDDALGEGGANPRDSRQSGSGGSKESGVPEAGKVWERGRNSVGVVVEVVPAVLDVTNVQGGDGDAELREDDDILEIPVFVRVEWEAEEVDEGPGRGKAEKGAKKNERVRRELAYWCVLGVGRVGRVGGL
jgi:dynactin-4